MAKTKRRRKLDMSGLDDDALYTAPVALRVWLWKRINRSATLAKVARRRWMEAAFLAALSEDDHRDDGPVNL